MLSKYQSSTLKRFWKMIQPEHKIFYGLIACSFVGNLLVVILTFVTAIGIDRLVLLLREYPIRSIPFEAFQEMLTGPIVILLGLAITSSIFSWLQERAMASLSERVTLRVRKEVTKKFKKLPMSFFDNHQVGDIISRTTTDLNQLSQVLLTGMNQFFTSISTILFAGIMLFYIDMKITLVVLVLIMISTFVTKKFTVINQQKAEESQRELGILNSKMEEFLSGNLVTKTFNQQEQAEASIWKENQKHFEAFKKAQFLNYAVYPVIRFINQLAFIASGILGAFLVLSGGISLGFLQAYLQYINQISEPISTASYVINSIQASLTALKRIFYILDQEEEEPEVQQAKELPQPKGEINFKNVKFGYSEDKVLMNDVAFSAKPKQTIAVVGPTGAGKTTLVNLLMRFYEINDGTIEFDQVDIRHFSRKKLRSLFGMVLQNTWLFEGTVAENIAYGKMDATREEIVEAAKAAQCDHFIRSLPQGYDTVISSDNGTLSQGQQQLLTIARILLANPPVVILDEATSSVDTRTERQIQRAMEKATEGRTSFVIAHRLSTIEKADLILVMKQGNIIEKGTHKELLSQPTLYRSLYNSQFQSAV